MQQYCRTFLNSFARSVVCLALFVPVCDYADAETDDKPKNSHSTHRRQAVTSSHSSGYSHSVRERQSTNVSGIHRSINTNNYNGLNRNRIQQDQRKKMTGSGYTSADKNTGLHHSSGISNTVSESNRNKLNRYNRIAEPGEPHGQSGKNPGTTNTAAKFTNTSAFVQQNKNPDKKQVNFSEHNSNQYQQHYDNSRQHDSPDKINSGKSEHNKHQANTHHDNNGYRYYIKKHNHYKKHAIKKQTINRVFFTAYSFVPYSYYTYYNYYYPGLLAYSELPYNNTEGTYFTASTYETESSGWVQLSNGRIISALESFQKEIECYPSAGIPRVGYALVIAANGDLLKAVLAMREALRYDPESLQYIYLDDKLLDLVDGLIERYEYPLQFNDRRPDEAFMLSALYYLEQDYLSAYDMLGRAMADGDNSPGVNNLSRIINEQLQENYAGDYN